MASGFKSRKHRIKSSKRLSIAQATALTEKMALVFGDIKPTFRRCGSDFFICCENLETKRFWAEIMQF